VMAHTAPPRKSSRAMRLSGFMAGSGAGGLAA
jgi:hypothetical protein